MSRGSSRRLTDAPNSLVTAISVLSLRALFAGGAGRPRRCGSHAATRTHRLGGGLDGRDDVLVAGAPAQIAFELLADLLVGRIGVALQDADRGHHHARGAEATLQAVQVPKRLLHWMVGFTLRQPLHRVDL